MIGKYPRTAVIREGRRARAEAVQAANVRTPEEQLARLNQLGFTASKERSKLARKIKQAAERTALEQAQKSKKKNS